MSVTIPDTIPATEMAAKLGWSARRLKSLARQIGACRILGNRMMLTQSDIDTIMEATRPQPAPVARSAPAGDYEMLKKFRATIKKKGKSK